MKHLCPCGRVLRGIDADEDSETFECPKCVYRVRIVAQILNFGTTNLTRALDALQGIRRELREL